MLTAANFPKSGGTSADFCKSLNAIWTAVPHGGSDNPDLIAYFYRMAPRSGSQGRGAKEIDLRRDLFCETEDNIHRSIVH